MKSRFGHVAATVLLVGVVWSASARAVSVTHVGELSSGVPSDAALTVVSTDGAEMLARGGGSQGYVFTEPPGGWGSGTAAAQLNVPGEGAANGTGGVIGGPLAVLDVGEDPAIGVGPVPPRPYGEVFVEPPGGWQGALSPSARLQDSGDGGVFPSAIAGGDVFATATPLGTSHDVIDVFAAPATGWSGTVAESARLQDDRGWRTDLRSVDGAGVIAEVGDDRGHIGFDLFAQPSSGWSGTLHETARLDVTAAPTGRAAPGAAVITVDDRVFARPASGWHGAIRPVAALFPQDTQYNPEPQPGAQFAGTRAILQATPRGSATTPDQPVITDYWFFDPPAGGWSGTVASGPVFRFDGTLEGSTGFSDGAGGIDVWGISGLRQQYGHRPLAPTAQLRWVRGLASGSPSLRLTARVRDAGPPIVRVGLILSAGLSFDPRAVNELEVNGRLPGSDRTMLHTRSLSFSTPLAHTLDIRLPTGTLHETRQLKQRAQHRRGHLSRLVRAGRITIRLIDGDAQTTTRVLNLTGSAS